MMAKTHQAFAVFSLLMVEKFIPGSVGDLVVASGLVMCGALLPDIDSPQSSFGRLIPFISKPLHSMLGHRTITHSLLATLALYAVLAASPRWHVYAFVVGLGYASHILGDMLIGTHGVALFWPLKQKITFNPLRMKVAGMAETLLFNLLIIAILFRGLHQLNPAAFQVLVRGIAYIV